LEKQALDGSKKGANSDPYRSLEAASHYRTLMVVVVVSIQQWQ